MNTPLRSAALALSAIFLATPLFAATWAQTAASSAYKWFDSANWNPAPPNAVGADANFPDANNTRTVSLQGAVTLGSIEYNITGIRSMVIANGTAFLNQRVVILGRGRVAR